jgi:hypothetical protein
VSSVLAEAYRRKPRKLQRRRSQFGATCQANGIRQFHLEAGAGPPVILLQVSRDQLRLSLPDSSTCARNDAREAGCEGKKSNRVHAGR